MMPWRRDTAAAGDSDALDRIRGLLQQPNDPHRVIALIIAVVRGSGRPCRPYQRPDNGMTARLDLSTAAAPAGVVDVPGFGITTVRVTDTAAGPHLDITVALTAGAAGRQVRVAVDGHTTLLVGDPA